MRSYSDAVCPQPEVQSCVFFLLEVAICAARVVSVFFSGATVYSVPRQ